MYAILPLATCHQHRAWDWGTVVCTHIANLDDRNIARPDFPAFAVFDNLDLETVKKGLNRAVGGKLDRFLHVSFVSETSEKSAHRDDMSRDESVRILFHRFVCVLLVAVVEMAGISSVDRYEHNR